MKPLYFDTSATTPVYPEVVKAMNDIMLENYANPSSEHQKGSEAKKLINNARANVAKHLGAKASEIFFTSGTTESNNWIFSGLAHTIQNKKKILISSIEHPSISETANLFKNWGYQIVEIPVNEEGFVDLEFIEKNIDSNTLFVSVMHANNIFGTIQDIKKIGDICKRKGTLFHTDAAQSFGKIKILTYDWNVDLLSASAHKMGGPKGIGILYVREGVKFSPLIQGGGQERGMRSGTENTAGIIGLDKALEISSKTNWNKVELVRDYMIEKLYEMGWRLIGSKGKERLSTNICISMPYMDAQKLLYQLSAKGIYVSIGSACDSKKEMEDRALKAIKATNADINGSIRISLPYNVTKQDADYFIKVIKSLLEQ